MSDLGGPEGVDWEGAPNRAAGPDPVLSVVVEATGPSGLVVPPGPGLGLFERSPMALIAAGHSAAEKASFLILKVSGYSGVV